MSRAALPLALTMGEPGGVGPELSLKAWLALRETGPEFVCHASATLLRETGQRLGFDIAIRPVADAAEGLAIFSEAMPVMDLPLSGPVKAGTASPGHAPAVVASIEAAVAGALAGQVSAIVTNPIQKHSLHQAGFEHPGHTEFLQELAGPGHRSIMLLAGPELRVVPVTIHQSLRTALDDLTVEAIVETTLATAAGLSRDFGITKPRIAIAGLNPHAGENGDMGDEEIRIIAPACAELRRHGLDIAGPLPPDTMFTPRARARYDVAICMYHDQGLIPLKTLDVDGGVNVTLGLPFVRTSPDHGTALDIAGKGIADPGSLIAAMRLGAAIAARRSEEEA